MKCFTTGQIRRIDALTCHRQGITSKELMDRAGFALSQRIHDLIPMTSPVVIMVGPGNNGGDGLVVARHLHRYGYKVNVVLCNYGKPLSDDAAHQIKRTRQSPGIEWLEPSSPGELKLDSNNCFLIDSLFGSGLNRPLSDSFAETVEWMNAQQAPCIAIDLPSGLFGEDNSGREDAYIVRSTITLCLQSPRLACFLPENEPYVGRWETVDIGLDREAMEQTQTPWSMTVPEEAAMMLKSRPRFAHKGHFGRTLLIAGSPGMAGACVLAGWAALRSGTGLLSLKVPEPCLNIVQTAIPEATAITYTRHFWSSTDATDTWSAVAAGPGLGLSENAIESLECLLRTRPSRLVLDADALNALAKKRTLLELLPGQAILTPHPGEFDRLTSPHRSGFERLQTAIQFAQQYGVFVVLKGAFTACISPDGCCRFNLTGNPGMATGGSGDVLTGIIVSLLAQGYTQEEACALGTCLHGLAADLTLEDESQESLVAGDITAHLGKAFNHLRMTAHTRKK